MDPSLVMETHYSEKKRRTPMRKLRQFLKNTYFIHGLVALGFLALWGLIETQNQYILLGVYLSVAGALCGSLIKVLDQMSENRKDGQSK